MADTSRSPKRQRVSPKLAPPSTTTKPPHSRQAVRSSSPEGDSDAYYSSRQQTGRHQTNSPSMSRSHSQSGPSLQPSRAQSPGQVPLAHGERQTHTPGDLSHTVHTFYRGGARSGGDSEEDDIDMLGYAVEDDEDAGQEAAAYADRPGYAVEEDYEGEDYPNGEDDDNGLDEEEEDEEEELRRRQAREEGIQERARRRFRRYTTKMVLRGHVGGVAQVKFSPDGRLIASCGADATVRVWDAGSGKQLHVLEGHLAGISTVAWGPDSQTLASGSDDKSIWLWNAVSGKPYPTQFLGHHNYIYSIAFSPKGNMIVSGSYDEAVFLWDVRGARVMRSLPAHSDPVGGVDFARDGTLIVSCAGDGLVRIWDTATGQCLRTLVHEDNAPVSSVRFSPNAKYVLAWTLDSCVRLWDYVEGRAVKTYQGHANKRFSISGGFGTYGSTHSSCFVASGSEDGGLVLWDITDKKVLQRLVGHEGVVLGLDTVRDRIVSCGVDGCVRVWEVDLEEGVGDEGDHGEEEGRRGEGDDVVEGRDGDVGGGVVESREGRDLADANEGTALEEPNGVKEEERWGYKAEDRSDEEMS